MKALITFADPDTASRIVINVEEVEKGLNIDVKGEAGPGADPNAPFLAAALANDFLGLFKRLDDEAPAEEKTELVS